MKHHPTPLQVRWIERMYKRHHMKDLVPLFNKRFHCRRSLCAIRSIANNRGIKCGRPSGLQTGERCQFTKKQQCFISLAYKKYQPLEITPLFNKRFKTKFATGQIRSWLHNHGITAGRDCTFKPGIIPWNTGTKGMKICKPNSGTFKKGNVPPNRKPVGSERIDSKDGYIQIKVRQRDPYTGFPTRYRQKQVVLWERKHGKKVPKGSCIIFKDGDKRNFEDSNLVCITRNELARLNQDGYPYLPPEVKPAAFALVKLKVKIREVEKSHGSR